MAVRRTSQSTGRRVLALAVGLFGLASYAPPASAQTAFVARLTGAEMVPVVPGAGVADARVVLDPFGATFAYQVTGSFLDASPTLQVVDARAGAAGPVLFTLPGGGPIWSGTSPPLGPAQVDALRSGALAFVIASPAHPAGQVRGQITTGATTFGVNLDGAHMVPALPTSEIGYGRLSLSGSNLSFTFHATFSFGTGQVKEGVAGTVGATVTSFNQNGIGQWQGTFKPTAQQLAMARTGGLYVELTETGTGVKIRGQLRPINGYYGDGCPGATKTPSIYGYIEPSYPSTSWTAYLSIFDGAPNGACVLFLSPRAADVPLGACGLYVSTSPLLTQVLPLNASGNLAITAAVPVFAASPAWVQLQAFVPDPGAPNGQFAATVGLSFLVHDVLD